MAISKKQINTIKAPAAIGPYSQGIVAGNLVFVSGQIPIDPGSGNIVSDDVQAQTRQSLENVKAVLEAAGSSLDNVVKATVFISDMEKFGQINAVYETFFSAPAPARACVEVARLPKDVQVEIEVVALVGQ